MCVIVFWRMEVDSSVVPGTLGFVFGLFLVKEVQKVNIVVD